MHVKIAEIYMVKFNVSIWNRLKIMELFVNAKWIIHKYNAILNRTVTKLSTILTKCFFPYLNPTSYFNLSFSSGVFPSILKIATVIPVHKKRIKAVWLKLALYYPTLVKSLKILMYNRIYKFLDKNNIMYSLQFGFQQRYSTSNALFLTEAIMNALDDGNILL